MSLENASWKQETRVGERERHGHLRRTTVNKRKQHWTTYIPRHRNVLKDGPRILVAGHCPFPALQPEAIRNTARVVRQVY